jgi:hypothetical protein
LRPGAERVPREGAASAGEALRDIDIRTALQDRLRKLHAAAPDARLFHEFELGLNEARIDLAVGNGRLKSREGALPPW